MVTKKRFKVHSMIQDMEVGEIMDLELCEELIRKYGSLSDIHLLIEDNGNDMTYQEVVDLLNENEQLKQQVAFLEEFLKTGVQYEYYQKVYEENEQLKQENKKLQGKYDHLLWLYNGLGCEYDWLKDENEQLKQRNNRQYEQLGRLYDLIEQKEWRVLTDIIDDFKKSDEQLQKEWGTYGDVEWLKTDDLGQR